MTNASIKQQLWGLMRQLADCNRNCLICHQASSVLICHYCQHDLEVFDMRQYEGNLLNNVRLLRGLKQPAFSQLVALAEYRWPLADLLAELKFYNRVIHAKALAEVFYQRSIRCLPELPEMIIPIPLHATRLAERKFNQAAQLAYQLSRLSGIPEYADVLVRFANTEAQTRLTGGERLKNVRRSFRVSPQFKEILEQAEHVALFDDVVTTGATVSSAYRTLSAAFPNLQIDVWCLCITPEHR